MSETTTDPTIEFVRAGFDAYGKHDGAWWWLDEKGNPGLRVGALVNPVGSLVDALDAVQAAQAEVKRIHGIAKMRERRIGNLTGHLRYIAEAGCERVKRGLSRCEGYQDEDSSAPCNPCIARIALDQPVSPSPTQP